MTLSQSIFACITAPTSNSFPLIGVRLWIVQAKQGAQTEGKYAVYQIIANDPKDSHGTGNDAEDTLEETLVQFSAFAASAKEAEAIIRALRADLLTPGAMSGITVNGPVFRHVPREDDVPLHGAQLDLTFFHNPQAVAA